MPGLHSERCLHPLQASGSGAAAASPAPLPMGSLPPPPVLEASNTHPHAAAVPKHYQHCKHPGGCPRKSAYGLPGGLASACVLHKEPGMVDMISKRCSGRPGEECLAFPRYGPPGVGPATRCGLHQESDMVSKLCQFPEGCNSYPSYGSQGSPASMCSRHRAAGMESKTPRHCNTPGGCTNHPVYGLFGGTAARCHLHREPGSVDMSFRRCDFPGGCDKIPSCGFDAPAVRCSTHMEPGMVEVKKWRSCRADDPMAPAEPPFGAAGGSSCSLEQQRRDQRQRERSDPQQRAPKQQRAPEHNFVDESAPVATAAVATTAAAAASCILKYEWADPDLDLNLKVYTRFVMRAAWLKGQRPALLHQLERDGGASIHTSRLRSISSGGHILWSNSALPAARREEPAAVAKEQSGSLAAQNQSGLRKRCREEAGPGGISVPHQTSVDALTAPANAAAPSPVNPLNADRMTNEEVEEGGRRSGAAGLPGQAVGGTAVHAVGGAVLVAGAPQGPAGGAETDPAAPPRKHLPGAAPLTLQASEGTFEGDDVALEALLRKAAVMTAGAAADEALLLHAVTGWFDRWDGGMGELQGRHLCPSEVQR